MIAVLIFVVAAIAVYCSSIVVSSAVGAERDEAKIFPQRVLDLIFKPDPLKDSEVLEIKNSLQSVWGSGYDFNSSERWKAIMSMADDQRKVEILLLWLEIDSKIRDEKILKAINGQDGKIENVQSIIAGYHAWVKEFVEKYSDALLKAKNDELFRKDALLAEISKKLDWALQEVKRLENKLDEMPVQEFGVSQEEYDQLKADHGRRIAQLKDEIDWLTKRIEELKAEIDRLKKELTKKPKSFWAGVGALGGEKVYSNPLGVMADFAVFHTRPWMPVYVELGARKFLIKDFLAIQIFGSYGSSWFLGTGLVVNIKLLDLSISGGAQYLPDYLVGDLSPVQVYAELTHEGDWTRMSLRVIPWLNMVQLSGGVKF
ncbi:MAG: hypothetical protein Q7R99_02315 [bacterium]|nr:hypothetical protein [bacterium]